MNTTNFPLSCGLVASWLNFDGVDPFRTAKARSWRFPGDTPPEMIFEVVRRTVLRHDTLHTTVPAGPGPLRMVVHPVEGPIVEVDPGLVVDPAKIRELGSRLTAEPFDLAEQWPARWRLGRLTSGERLLIVVVHHSVAGAAGATVIERELAAVADNIRHGRDPETGLPPAAGRRDILSAETGIRGIRREEKLRAYLRDILRAVPSTPFPGRPEPCRSSGSARDVQEISAPAGPSRTRRTAVILTSPAMNWAVAQLADRWRTSPAMVVLAATSLAIRPALRDDNALVWRIFSDEAGHRSRSAAVAYEPMTTLVPAVGLPPDDDLRAASSAVWGPVVRALRLQPRGDCALLEEVHHVSADRGTRVEVPFFYNYTRQDIASRWTAAEAEERWDEITSADTIIEHPEWDHEGGGDFMVFALPRQDYFEIGLYAHERLAGTGLLRTVVERMRALVYQHALPQRAEAAGCPPPAVPRTRWIELAGNRWADLDVIRDTLNDLPMVERTDLRIEHHDGRPVLVAAMVTTGPVPPATLRRAASVKLDEPGFVIPDVFELEAGPRQHRAGTAGPASDPEAGAVWHDVLRDAGGLTEIDPSRSFLDGGGRVHDIPSVLQSLRTRGWSGLTWQDLSSHRSLGELARRLGRAPSGAPAGPPADR